MSDSALAIVGVAMFLASGVTPPDNGASSCLWMDKSTQLGFVTATLADFPMIVAIV